MNYDIEYELNGINKQECFLTEEEAGARVEELEAEGVATEIRIIQR